MDFLPSACFIHCILFLCINYSQIFPDVVMPSSLWSSSLLPITSLSTLSNIVVLPLVHMAHPSQPSLFILVTPNENLSIFIFVTSIFLSFLLVIVTSSMPYNIAGHTIVLYIFPLTFSGTLLSQSTPVIFLQLYQPLWILFSVFLSLPPSFCTVEPRYHISSNKHRGIYCIVYFLDGVFIQGRHLFK